MLGLGELVAYLVSDVRVCDGLRPAPFSQGAGFFMEKANMALLVFVLTVVGLTTILTEGKVFAVPRNWLNDRLKTKFFACPMCVGFWVGLVIQLVAPCPALQSLFPLRLLVAGFVGSWVSWAAFVVLAKLGSNDH